jgi:hypothetical protein
MEVAAMKTGVAFQRWHIPVAAFALSLCVLCPLIANEGAKEGTPKASNSSAKPTDEEATLLAAKVAGLIKQLDAANLAEREAAERALIALGPEALDVLPRGTTKLSAEVKQRLARVRQQLELAFAKTAAKASPITIAAGEYPLSEILMELVKQGNCPLVDARRESIASSGDPRIRVAFDKTPFWQALDKTLDAANASLAIRDARGEVPLQLAVVPRMKDGKPREQGAVYRGPLRFDIPSVDVKQDGDRAGRDLLRVVFEAAWEPRLHPISLTLGGNDLAAVDDQGRAIAVATPTAQWTTSSLGGQGAVRFTLPFVLPNRDAKSFTLKGKMSALLSGANVVFRFERLGGAPLGGDRLGAARPATVASQKIGDATVRIESFRRHNDEWHIRVRVVYDNPQEAVQSHFDWLYKSRAVLADGDEPRQPAEYDAQAAEDGVIATYAFKAKASDKPGEITLLYTTPAVIMMMPFDFEFAATVIPR